MCCLHLCCLDKNNSQSRFPQRSEFTVSHITDHRSQCPLLLMFPLSQNNRMQVSCYIPSYFGERPRKNISKLKTQLPFYYLCNSKRKVVLGHWENTVAIVHGIRQKWNTDQTSWEPASTYQAYWFVISSLTMIPISLADDHTTIRIKAKLLSEINMSFTKFSPTQSHSTWHLFLSFFMLALTCPMFDFRTKLQAQCVAHSSQYSYSPIQCQVQWTFQ